MLAKRNGQHTAGMRRGDGGKAREQEQTRHATRLMVGFADKECFPELEAQDWQRRASVDGVGQANSTCVKLQLPSHKGEHVIPTGKVKVASQSSQIVEEVPPSTQGLPDGLIHLA